MKKLSGFLLAGGVLSLTLTSFANGNEPPCEASRCVAVNVSQALAAVHEKVKAGVRIASQVKALENEAQALRIPRAAQAVTPVGAQSAQAEKDGENPAAQQEKPVKAEATGDDLAKIREEMAEVTRHLAKMKARDAEHQKQLELLESRLNEAAKKADSESKKLAAAAGSLVLWEERAQQAETDLGSTKKAMQTLVKVAEDTKAFNAQLQKQLALGAAELAERDRRLSTTAASLQQVQAVAEESRARAAELQAELENQTKRFETAAAAMKEAETERDTLRREKRAAEASLTQLKTELARVKQRADKVPDLEGKIAELETTVAKHTQAEILHEKQAKRMAASSEKMRARLNEILVEREELRDQLTILRNEFAQFRLDTKHAQVRTAKETVNQQQAALARAQALYHQALEKRNARLTQLESSLEAKEHALQIAYGLENEALAKLEHSEKTREDEAEVRQSLTLALEDLREELELSRKKACQLNEQLIELESLHPE